MTSLPSVLLCCDLDRTVLPNGTEPLSPNAEAVFKTIVQQENVTLCYVTGRDRNLILSAVLSDRLPLPDLAVGDVGTTIYTVQKKNSEKPEFIPLTAWEDEIAPDWNGCNDNEGELKSLLSEIKTLRLQEKEKQNTYKISFYAEPDADRRGLIQLLRNRFGSRQCSVEVIWSLDETTNTALLDVVPARATKLHAVRFLMREYGFAAEETLYAGDSGNDEAVLTSEIPSVLVRNATDDVRNRVVGQSRSMGTGRQLYLARGDFFGLNGNYSAGIVEGLYHFQPSMRQFIAQVCRQHPSE